MKHSYDSMLDDAPSVNDSGVPPWTSAEVSAEGEMLHHSRCVRSTLLVFVAQ